MNLFKYPFWKRFWYPLWKRQPIPPPGELGGLIGKHIDAGLDPLAALDAAAEELGRHPGELIRFLRDNKDNKDNTATDWVNPGGTNMKIFIQRNINIVRMVIGSSFIVLALLCISDSYSTGTLYVRMFSIAEPFYFTIGILLLISGAIILAKGVREYLR
jgi:hypothetical protein